MKKLYNNLKTHTQFFLVDLKDDILFNQFIKTLKFIYKNIDNLRWANDDYFFEDLIETRKNNYEAYFMDFSNYAHQIYIFHLNRWYFCGDTYDKFKFPINILKEKKKIIKEIEDLRINNQSDIFIVNHNKVEHWFFNKQQKTLKIISKNIFEKNHYNLIKIKKLKI
jgi:hypothetical protein